MKIKIHKIVSFNKRGYLYIAPIKLILQLKKTLLVIFLVFALCTNSCTKDNDLNLLNGKWRFLKACNLDLTIACITDKNRDFVEIIEFTKTEYMKYYNDSLVTNNYYHVNDQRVIFGDNVQLSKKYFLKNDTLTLIDTCFACYSTKYIRIKN